MWDFGDAGFSFYPVNTLPSGEGGMIILKILNLNCLEKESFWL